MFNVEGGPREHYPTVDPMRVVQDIPRQFSVREAIASLGDKHQLLFRSKNNGHSQDWVMHPKSDTGQILFSPIGDWDTKGCCPPDLDDVIFDEVIEVSSRNGFPIAHGAVNRVVNGVEVKMTILIAKLGERDIREASNFALMK